MKVYKVEILVLDFEDMGEEEIKLLIEDYSHMNASVMKIESKEIGEWSDNNSLNICDKQNEAYKELFG